MDVSVGSVKFRSDGKYLKTKISTRLNKIIPTYNSRRRREETTAIQLPRTPCYDASYTLAGCTPLQEIVSRPRARRIIQYVDQGDGK